MTASTSESIIKKCLKDGGIEKVAIIDDAYDPPTINSLRTGEIGDFWEAIVRDTEMVAKLNDLSPGIADGDDITNETISILWQNRGKLGKLDSVCDSVLFNTALQKLKDIESLNKHLKDLGLDVLTFGSRDNLDDKSISLIFIDYYFEPPGEGTPGAIALSKVKYILNLRTTDPNKPFFVLMSAREDVRQKIDQFCNDSKLLKGLFDFVPKAELNSKAILYLKLKTLAIGMPARHEIQRFIDAVEVSLNKTTGIFMEKIRGLSLEDYINIQLLCLQPDGEPLGEYILDLFKTLLPNIAFENDGEVQRTRKVLDQLELNPFIPFQRSPTINLAEIYRVSITQPINNEVRFHPRRSKTDTSPQLPYLQLGDLLIKKDQKEILMITSPNCDLAFSPGEKRKGDPDYTVILIPGKLKQLGAEKTDSESKIHFTPLFELDGRLFRVEWEYEHFVTKKLNEIMKLIDTEGYTLDTRLRLPYALEIQQIFATNLTRVGLPIPPPLYEYVDIETFCEGKSGKLEKLREPIKNGGYIIHLKSDHKLVLTVESFQQILSNIERVIDSYQNKLDQCSTEKKDNVKRNRLKAKIQNLHECKSNGGQFLVNLEKQWELPKNVDNVKDLIPNLLCIYINNNRLEGSDPPNTPICLNINYNIDKLKETKPSLEVSLEICKDIKNA